MNENTFLSSFNSDDNTYFSQGLRMNRTLLSLNLGSNLIGDNGASKLAEVSKTLSLRLTFQPTLNNFVYWQCPPSFIYFI